MGAGSGRDESFGLRLRRLRVAANLTQEDLAGRAGLSVNAIGLLERGLRRIPRPSSRLYGKLARTRSLHVYD